MHVEFPQRIPWGLWPSTHLICFSSYSRLELYLGSSINWQDYPGLKLNQSVHQRPPTDPKLDFSIDDFTEKESHDGIFVSTDKSLANVEGSLRVAVRIRPMNSREESAGHKVIIKKLECSQTVQVREHSLTDLEAINGICWRIFLCVCL